MALNRKAAEEFARYWAGRGDEKGETQQFWIDLLQNVLGDDDALRHLRSRPASTPRQAARRASPTSSSCAPTGAGRSPWSS